MCELKKMERYLRVNLLGPGPRLVEKGFTGQRSHKGSETLSFTTAHVIPLYSFDLRILVQWGAYGAAAH